MHDQFLRRAIRLAVENVELGRGGPFGAVIVKDGAVLAEGTNLVTSLLDPTAHAEVVAIRAACAASCSFDLRGASIYASCEPCPMCLAAIYWARLDHLYYAASKDDASAAGFDDSIIYSDLSLPEKKRRLPSLRLLAEEGRQPFTTWLASNRKVAY